MIEDFNPELFIAGYVSRYGNADGVCLITWLPLLLPGRWQFVFFGTE